MYTYTITTSFYYIYLSLSLSFLEILLYHTLSCLLWCRFRPGVKFIQDEEARSLLPLCPPLYSQDSLTDRSERCVVCSCL